MGGIFVESVCRADVLNDRAKAAPGNDLEEHFENSYGKLARPGGDFISLTDMVRTFDGADALIEHWLKSKDTAGCNSSLVNKSLFERGKKCNQIPIWLVSLSR